MADFTSPEATATRAALQVYPFLEGMVPYPSVTPNTPISPEDFIRGKMSPYGIEPTFQGDFTKLFRGENLLNNRGVGRYWGLDPGTSNFFALPNIDPDIAPHTSATSYTGVIPTSEAARAVDVIPAMPGFSDVPTISQITVSPESSELIKSGRGASATAEALSENVKALEAGIPGTGTDPNPFLKAGRGFLKTLGRVTPWANVAGGALASYDYGQKDQNVREGLAALSTVPYFGMIPFAAETAINFGERLLGDPAMAADVAMPDSTYVPDPNYDAQAIQSALISADQQGTTSSGSDQVTPMFMQGTESLLPSINQRDELSRLAGAAFAPSYLDLDFGMGREEAAGRLLNQFVINPEQVAPFVGGSLIPPESPITTLPSNVTDLNVPTPVQPVEETQPIWKRALQRITETLTPDAEARKFVQGEAVKEIDRAKARRARRGNAAIRSGGASPGAIMPFGIDTGIEEEASFNVPGTPISTKLTRDRENWRILRDSGALDETSEDAHDVREHLDTVYGDAWGDEAWSPWGKEMTLTNPEDWWDTTKGFMNRVGREMVQIAPDTIRLHALGFHDSVDNANEMTDEGQITEKLKDLVNNQVFNEARKEGLSPDEAYVDPNVVFDEEIFDNLARTMAAGIQEITETDIEHLANQPGLQDQVKKSGVIETKTQSQASSERRRRAVAKKDAELNKAIKEKKDAEKAKAKAKTVAKKAKAEQNRLAALSRQRAAEERVRKASQSKLAKAAEAERVRQQKSASAAALASARMESLRQVDLMRKRREEKLLQDKLADQMARYQTTGRWVGGL